MSSENSNKKYKSSNNISENFDSYNDNSNSNINNRKKFSKDNYNNYSSNKNKKVNSNNSDSNKILTNILDNKKIFNIYSPSHLKQMTDELKIIEKQKN